MDKYTVVTSIKKVFATVSAVAIIGTAFVGGQSAFAASSTGITGDPLTWSAPTVGNFANVKLNGKVQTTNATIDNFTVTDASGTGAGWNVTVKASQLTTVPAAGSDEEVLTLPMDSIKISAPKVTAEAGASDVLTIKSATGTIDNATGVELLSAEVDGGMGMYNMTFEEPALTLTLNPKDVKAGNYTSTITVSITTGP